MALDLAEGDEVEPQAVLEAGQALGEGLGLLPARPREEGEGVEVHEDHLRPPAHEAVGGHRGVNPPGEEGHHPPRDPGGKPPGARVALHLQEGRPGEHPDHELPLRPLEPHRGARFSLHESPEGPLYLRGGEGKRFVGALGGDAEAPEGLALQGLF